MSTDLPLAIQGVSAATLRQLAVAFQSGRLTAPVTPFAVAIVAACPAALLADIQRLSAEGMSSPHLGILLSLAADTVEARMINEACAELVWTGPEAAGARSRDTIVVLDELFASAQQSVLVSTFVVHRPDRVFAKLGARLDEIPNLLARIFVNVERRPGDTRLESALVHDYARRLGDRWPGRRRPEVYFDPRALLMDDDARASWHAKCVLVDDKIAFVTSANFTEYGQQRNVEAGALIQSRHFTSQLRSQLESLIHSKQVKRLSGF
jgi:phosphatidylserine/phosphatidylglycerophosphate/cardiolipin synthase-like enzyme